MQRIHLRPSTPQTAQRRCPRFAGIALGIVFIALAHVVGRVGSFCSPVRADSYAYACIGYRIAQGATLYSPQLSDVKPPALYHLYALGYLLLPPGRYSMIPFDALFAALGYWAMYLLARDMYGHGVGLIVAATAAFAQNALNVWDFGTEAFGLAESFMIFPAALAVRQYRRGMTTRDITPLLWCGVWLGVEASFKQTALPLAAAVAAHWTALAFVGRISWRRWATGAVGIAAGIVLALAPWVTYLMFRGTLWRMLEVLGPGAAGQLAKFTARPDDWNNVLPLWVPMAWGALALLAWVESAHRRIPAGGGSHWPTPTPDIAFLLIWLALEYIMLIFLPFRSFHYYVVSSLPLILLSGSFWTALAAAAGKLPPRRALACTSVAAVLSLAFARTAIDRIVPMTLGRFQAYDRQVDQAFFDAMAARNVINFGLPPNYPLADQPPP